MASGSTGLRDTAASLASDGGVIGKASSVSRTRRGSRLPRALRIGGRGLDRHPESSRVGAVAPVRWRDAKRSEVYAICIPPSQCAPEDAVDHGCKSVQRRDLSRSSAALTRILGAPPPLVRKVAGGRAPCRIASRRCAIACVESLAFPGIVRRIDHGYHSRQARILGFGFVRIRRRSRRIRRLPVAPGLHGDRAAQVEDVVLYRQDGISIIVNSDVRVVPGSRTVNCAACASARSAARARRGRRVRQALRRGAWEVESQVRVMEVGIRASRGREKR